MSYSKDLERRGVKPIVTWWRDRWRKQMGTGPNKTTKYFAYPDTRDGYERAVADYYRLKDDLKPNAADYKRAISQLEQIATSQEVEGSTAVIKTRQRIQNLQAESLKPNPAPLDEIESNPLKFVTQEGRAIIQDRNRIAKRLKSNNKNLITLGQAATEFLALAQTKAETGKGSVASWDDYRRRLKPFREWYGDEKPLDTIDETVWRDYYKYLCTRGNSLKLQKTARAFINWCYRNGQLTTLPRNLTDPQYGFTNNAEPHDENQLYIADDLKQLLDFLPLRYQACTLLALNCGMTQVDLACFNQTHLKQINTGRLIYKRHKTYKVKKVLPINYQLWDMTVQAVMRYAAENPSNDLIFKTREGLPIQSDRIRDGKREDWCVISKYWQDRKKAGDIPDKPFSFFRKTGSTFCDEVSLGLGSVYCGHAPNNVTNKHYIVKGTKPYKPLDDAIAALGTHLGLDRQLPKKPKKQKDEPYTDWE